MKEKEGRKDTWKHLGPWNQPDFRFVPKTYQPKSKQQFSQLEWRGLLIAPCLCICCRNPWGSITGVRQAATFRWVSELTAEKQRQDQSRDSPQRHFQSTDQSRHSQTGEVGDCCHCCTAFPECQGCTGSDYSSTKAAGLLPCARGFLSSGTNTLGWQPFFKHLFIEWKRGSISEKSETGQYNEKEIRQNQRPLW